MEDDLITTKEVGDYRINLKMVGYFRGSEKEGQVFCDMITECIEKYEQRGLYSRGKLNN